VSDEAIFAVCNYSVVPFWLLLIAAPRWRGTQRLVHSGAFVWLLVPIYAWLLFFDRPGPQGASFFTLEGVTRIFTTPRTITACWVHYLVFDLFVGAWEARDAARRKIPHLVVAPSLVVTLLFGPVGLLSYLALRGLLRRRWALGESEGPAG
jgi:hypothetical protein